MESLLKLNTTDLNLSQQSNQSKKRERTDDTLNLSNKIPAPSNLPKFLIISSPDHILGKVSPFIIQKGFQGIGGAPKTVKKLTSGDFLIETTNDLQSKSFLLAKSLASIEISVTPHKALNSSRGVISETDLQHVSEKEILENLSEQGVIDVKRISIKRGNELIATKHIILTFNTPDIPPHVIAGYLRCALRPYIPNPLRCFKCQRFGHSKTSCRGREACARCSNTEPNHDFQNCTSEAKCINCSGNHPAFSRSCPKWSLEKKIQETKHKLNISYPEARKIVDSNKLRDGVTFSSALSKSKPITKNAETQTEIDAPPKVLSLPKLPKIQQTNMSKTQASSASQTPLPSRSDSQKNEPIKNHTQTPSQKQGLKQKSKPGKVLKMKLTQKFEDNSSNMKHNTNISNKNSTDSDSEGMVDPDTLAIHTDCELSDSGDMQVDEGLEVPTNLLSHKLLKKPSKLKK